MDKLDYRKQYNELYAPSKKEISIVKVPAFNFLMIDGTGDPNTSPRMQAAFWYNRCHAARGACATKAGTVPRLRITKEA